MTYVSDLEAELKRRQNRAEVAATVVNSLDNVTRALTSNLGYDQSEIERILQPLYDKLSREP